MVVTTRNLVITVSKARLFHGCYQVAACLEQPTKFALEQPCFWVVTWLEFLYGNTEKLTEHLPCAVHVLQMYICIGILVLASTHQKITRALILQYRGIAVGGAMT